MDRSDPIIGIWNLNVANSKFSTVLLKALNETVPKEATEIYRLVGDQIELTVENTMTGGRRISGRYTWPRYGGVAKAQEDVASFTGVTIIETLIAPGEWYATFLKNEKQFIVVHKVVGKDGQTMSLSSTGIDDQGKPFEQIVVYDRQ
jgi:hypothetical protein